MGNTATSTMLHNNNINAKDYNDGNVRNHTSGEGDDDTIRHQTKRKTTSINKFHSKNRGSHDDLSSMQQKQLDSNGKEVRQHRHNGNGQRHQQQPNKQQEQQQRGGGGGGGGCGISVLSGGGLLLRLKGKNRGREKQQPQSKQHAQHERGSSDGGSSGGGSAEQRRQHQDSYNIDGINLHNSSDIMTLRSSQELAGSHLSSFWSTMSEFESTAGESLLSNINLNNATHHQHRRVTASHHTDEEDHEPLSKNNNDRSVMTTTATPTSATASSLPATEDFSPANNNNATTFSGDQNTAAATEALFHRPGVVLPKQTANLSYEIMKNLGHDGMLGYFHPEFEDVDDAMFQSKITGRPILCLDTPNTPNSAQGSDRSLQDSIGREVLSHPLIVEAMECLFETVHTTYPPRTAPSGGGATRTRTSEQQQHEGDDEDEETTIIFTDECDYDDVSAYDYNSDQQQRHDNDDNNTNCKDWTWNPRPPTRQQQRQPTMMMSRRRRRGAYEIRFLAGGEDSAAASGTTSPEKELVPRLRDQGLTRVSLVASMIDALHARGQPVPRYLLLLRDEEDSEEEGDDEAIATAKRKDSAGTTTSSLATSSTTRSTSSSSLSSCSNINSTTTNNNNNNAQSSSNNASTSNNGNIHVQDLRAVDDGRRRRRAGGVRRQQCKRKDAVFGLTDTALGEVEFAGFNGVKSTRRGHVDRQGVVLVEYNPKILSYSELVRFSLQRKVGDILYYQTNDERIAATMEASKVTANALVTKLPVAVARENQHHRQHQKQHGLTRSFSSEASPPVNDFCEESEIRRNSYCGGGGSSHNSTSNARMAAAATARKYQNEKQQQQQRQIKYDDNSKSSIRETPMRFVPLTAYQSMKINRLIHLGKFNEAMHILSPRQGLILMHVMRHHNNSSRVGDGINNSNTRNGQNNIMYDVVDLPILPAWVSVCDSECPLLKCAKQVEKEGQMYYGDDKEITHRF